VLLIVLLGGTGAETRIEFRRCVKYGDVDDAELYSAFARATRSRSSCSSSEAVLGAYTELDGLDKGVVGDGVASTVVGGEETVDNRMGGVSRVLAPGEDAREGRIVAAGSP